MTAATTPAEAVRQPRRGLTGGWSLGASLFIAPAVFLLLVFLVYPVLQTIVLSFAPGFDNYIRLLTADPKFLDLSTFPPQGALFNNLLWVVFYTSGCILAGLLVAVMATRVRYEAGDQGHRLHPPGDRGRGARRHLAFRLLPR